MLQRVPFFLMHTAHGTKTMFQSVFLYEHDPNMFNLFLLLNLKKHTTNLSNRRSHCDLSVLISY